LALVFVLSYAWGACAACSPVSQPQSDVHACCKHAGERHCGESAPEPAKHSNCPHEKRALTAYDRAETDGLPLVAVFACLPASALSVEPIAIEATQHAEAAAYSHAPPELFVLHSAFRI
jgi:hypothetical protein